MTALFGLLSSLLNVLAVAVGVGLVIFVHELGHFAVAKWAGVLVERFSIGFGPVLWRHRRGETEYVLSALPFGGYVKMLGQDDMRPSETTDEEIRIDPRSYPAQSVPKRMAIISAGVVMNIIFGFLAFLLVFNVGVSYTPAIVGNIEPGSPAWTAGLERGDKIIKVNGKEIVEFEQLIQAVALTDPAADVGIEVERGEQRHSFRVTPVLKDGHPYAGIYPPWDLLLAAESPVAVGTAASKAHGFEGNDRITHINGEPVQTYGEFATRLAQHAPQAVKVTVQRGGASAESKGATAEIDVPPQHFRHLGVQLRMGKVTAVRRGSPAEAAGIVAGDLIQNVNGEPFDPIRLPDMLWELRGGDVEIAWKRVGELFQRTVRLEERPGWLYPPRYGENLAAPALGIAYELEPVVAAEPSAPAAQAGLERGDRIVGAVLLVHPERPRRKWLFWSSSEPAQAEYDFQTDHPMLPGLFWDLQHLDSRTELKLRVQRGHETVETRPFVPEFDETWYSPLRGIKLVQLDGRLEGLGFTQSIVRGYQTTRSTLVTIYLALRRLIVRPASSVKSLSGPVLIAVEGYRQASTDIMKLIKFMAMLSINLAVINFLPIPVLDGGHMVFLAWEGIRGKPPNERVLVIATYCGLLLILTLALVVTGQDIFNLMRWIRAS